MENNKRSVKEAAVARENVYEVLAEMETNFAPIGYEVVGRATEGLILRDKETDLYVVVRAVAKAIDFDAEDAMEEFVEKAEKAKEKKEKAAEKAKKDKEKRKKKAEEVAEEAVEEA